MILTLVNTVAGMALLGSVIYTRVLFKRPAITETTERTRLQEAKPSPTPPPVAGNMEIKELTVNIRTSPQLSAEETQKIPENQPAPVKGKMHYVTLAIVLQMRDVNQKAKLQVIQFELTDQLLSLLGKKSFSDLNQVQGKYALRTQILELANKLAQKELKAPPQAENAFTDVYFTQFLIQ